MTTYKAIAAKLGPQTYFPNTSSVGHFSPKSFTVHVGQIGPQLISGKHKTEQFGRLRKELGVIVHELTHWADAVGTYWGRQYLRKIFECHRIVPRVTTPGVEDDFWKFVDLHDEDRRFRLPDYYHTVDKRVGKHNPNRPWEMQFSSGIEFDSKGKKNPNRPIIFFKFIDHELSTVAVRQPLTVGALLETTAMHSEIEASAKAIASLPDGERRVEEILWKKELDGYLFDKEFTVYTAPAHTIGYYTGISDTRVRYRVAARLAFLCLNLTPRYFDRLTPPDSMASWKGRFKAFKDTRNVAFAFAVICAQAGKFRDNDNLDSWVARGLRKSRLPSEEEVIAEARREIERQAPQEAYSRLGVTENYLLDIGKTIFEHRVSNCTIDIDRAAAASLPLPPMFNDNEDLFTLDGGSFDMAKFDSLEMYLAEWDLLKETQNFLKSCR